MNKARVAVSYLVDQGHRGMFDKDMVDGKDISFMIQKERDVTPRIRRKRNIWILDAFVG